MANRVEKSHWDHDCGNRTDVTATIVMLQPADLPMLSTEGKAFCGRIYRDGQTIHQTSERATLADAADMLDHWLNGPEPTKYDDDDYTDDEFDT